MNLKQRLLALLQANATPETAGFAPLLAMVVAGMSEPQLRVMLLDIQRMLGELLTEP